MNVSLDPDVPDAPSPCPTCGHALPCQEALPPFDAPCSACGLLPWGRVIRQKDSVVLEVLPGRTPSVEDIGRFVDNHVRTDECKSVVCDLSALDTVSSSLAARLATLKKHVRSADGRPILCWVCPVGREGFFRLALDRIFAMIDDEHHAPGRYDFADS